MKKNILTIILALIIQLVGYSQEDSDSLSTSSSINDDEIEITGAGVAVTPPSIRFAVKPGKQETRTITVTNDTHRNYEFKVIMRDFDMDDGGVTGISDVVDTNKVDFSISKMVNIAPSYFKMKPGEKRKVNVTIKVPDTEEANFAAWGMLVIKQATVRKQLDMDEYNKNTIAMGITPQFSFAVFLYQNPPNVEVNKTEITNLELWSDPDGLQRSLNVTIENVGDGIASIKSYVEVTNLSTGEQSVMPETRLTLLPRKTRVIRAPLAQNIQSGKYSAIAVIDFGDDETVEAAELEFEIP